ncbi:MAG: SurA N-terminal domain-containing protein [Spirochaetes bacterium]|nr:SurA N-terminal domain-containing protein [Spirochaetota bacterium]
MVFDKETQRKVIMGVAILLAIAFIALVYFEWGKGGAASSGTFEVARVNGHSIYIQEFRNLFEQVKEMNRERVDDDKTGQVNKELMIQTLYSLVQRYLILQEADRADVGVSENETFRNVIRRREFQTESGQFNEFLYRRLPSSFKKKLETDTREGLIEQLFLMRLLDSVKISDLDLRLYFQQKNTKCRVRFVYLKVPEGGGDKNLLGMDENRVKIEKAIDRFIKMAKQSNFDTAANALGLEVKATDYFSFFGPINKPGSDNRWTDLEVQGTYQEAFKLKPFQVSDKISTPNGYIAIQLIGRMNPNWNTFYKDLPKLKAELEGLRRNYIRQQWYITVVQRSKIRNNLNKLLGEDSGT